MISLQQLHYCYKSSKPVLSNISLRLEPGKIYGLLGKNGVGKTTLMQIIAGLLFPQKGTVQVNERTPSKREPAFLQDVFLLPEAFTVPNLTIAQYKRLYAPFYAHFDENAFEQHLKDFSLPNKGSLRDFSHGQQKKILISFALATKAKVILMDEPTNGLDIPSKRQFRKIIAGAFLDNQTYIISTHQVKDLDMLIDDVIVMDDTQVIFNQPIAHITERMLFKQVLNLSEEAPQHILYSEGSIKGHVVALANTTGIPSRMDVEFFFNTLMANKPAVLQLFHTSNN
ncbi:ABC-2 type transport system ATP-binding protein [Chitinophaga skermanii]|uniref:ABC-2 type transport system ATP-binding protein n=1 Tax=Chitinophaga skermanii TaxID=331697 RepID=A0A327R294_9BACT|nr:ABC transporter ATP-binding protein [Chitinophaga skermanii]RAJ10751.1 ABC-2 type transport system ATP-binding protein [Chitinophaga skermanii]